MTTRIDAVVAVALVVAAAGLAVVLADSKTRQSGTNYIAEVEPVAAIKGRDRRCQPGQVVPADTGALRLLVGTYGRQVPGLVVTVRSGGRKISSGRFAGGPEGHVAVPLELVRERVADATVCVEVIGTTPRTRTVLYGQAGQLRLEWLRPGSDSWFGVLGTVADRFGFGHGTLEGAWLAVLAGLLLAGAWVVALRLTMGELRR